MIIRPEQLADAAAIEYVTIAAFKNAPHSSGTEPFIVRELRAANALTVSLLAEIAGQVVGHVAISPVQISDGASNWYGLGPVSVLPTYQGKGIGVQLIDAALARVQAMSAAGCVVLGEPEYYVRFGFAPFPGLELPGVPAEYFQAILWSSCVPQGEVAYHPAFEAKQ